jgi:hypothetical protein
VKPPGAVDTLAGGFEVVNRHPWIVLVPIALDLFLWLGPQLAPLPALGDVLNGYQDLLAQGGVPAPPVVAPGAVATTETGGDVLTAWGRFNGFSLLGLNFVAAVPSLIAARSGLVPDRATIPVGSASWLVGSGIGLEVAGLCLAGIYFGFVGQQVRDGETTPNGVLRGAVRYSLRYLRVALLAVAALLAVSLAGGIALAAATLLGPVVAALAAEALTTTLLVCAMVGSIAFFFTKDAIVVGELGALAALAASATLVRRNVWSAVGLILLIHLVVWGFQAIWAELARLAGNLGLVAGIVGNAYLGSGAAAATMRFYNARAADLPRRRRLGGADSRSEAPGPPASRTF